jgi:hypothetical protein
MTVVTLPPESRPAALDAVPVARVGALFTHVILQPKHGSLMTGGVSM